VTRRSLSELGLDSSGTQGLALLLGPNAGRGLWHGDVVASLLYNTGSYLPAGRSMGWSDVVDALAGDLDRYRRHTAEAFKLQLTDDGEDALGLLACILGRADGPRVYWCDPHHQLSDLVTSRDVHVYSAEELNPPSLRELLAGSRLSAIDIFQLIATGPSDANGAADRRSIVANGLSNHSTVILWGWAQAAAPVFSLLPDDVTNRVAFLGPPNGSEPSYRNTYFGDGVAETSGEFAATVLDFLRSIAPEECLALSSEDGADAEPVRRSLRLMPSTGTTLANAVVASIYEDLRPKVEGGEAHVGVVVPHGGLRSALAQHLADQRRGVRVRIDAPEDLDAIDLRLWPTDAARQLVVVDAAVELPDPEIGGPDFRPSDTEHGAYIYVMPQIGGRWDNAGRRVELVSISTIEQHVLSVLTTFGEIGIDLAGRVIDWLRLIDDDADAQWRFQVLDRVLADGTPDLGPRLIAMVDATRPPAGLIRITPRREERRPQTMEDDEPTIRITRRASGGASHDAGGAR
jgi:hypothetical protein